MSEPEKPWLGEILAKTKAEADELPRLREEVTNIETHLRQSGHRTDRPLHMDVLHICVDFMGRGLDLEAVEQKLSIERHSANELRAELATANARAEEAEKRAEKLEERVCDECDGSGWSYNRIDGKHPCVCMVEAEPYQELKIQLGTEQKKCAAKDAWISNVIGILREENYHDDADAGEEALSSTAGEGWVKKEEAERLAEAAADYAAQNLTKQIGEVEASLSARDAVIRQCVEFFDCGSIKTPDFLEWLADRLVHQYGESASIDFVVSLRKRADMSRSAIAAANAILKPDQA